MLRPLHQASSRTTLPTCDTFTISRNLGIDRQNVMYVEKAGTSFGLGMFALGYHVRVE